MAIPTNGQYTCASEENADYYIEYMQVGGALCGRELMALGMWERGPHTCTFGAFGNGTVFGIQ